MPSSGPDLAILQPIFAAAAACIAGGLSVFSRVVSIQRERYRAAWEADGRPTAPWIVPWRIPPVGDPSRPQGLQDLFRTNRLSRRWLLSTPEWARHDAEVLRLLWLYRGLQVVGIACVVAWCAVLLPHFGRR
jgi:hypothetical protein